jgi:DNA-directed RNA polymerase subunit beta'
MIIPDSKRDILKKAENQVTEIGRQYTEGLITQGEKYNKVVDIWAKATDDVANAMMDVMKMAPVLKPNGAPLLDAKGKPVRASAVTDGRLGRRGSKQNPPAGRHARSHGQALGECQFYQANFRDGLSVLQYFIPGAAGLATLLKIINPGC